MKNFTKGINVFHGQPCFYCRMEPDGMESRKRAISGRSAQRMLLPFLLTIIWLLPHNASADSFRCGQKVVRSGDSTSRVLSACGKPRHKDSGQTSIWAGSSEKKVKVQRWYYQTSGRRLGRVVLIYQGKVIAVKTEGR